MIFPKELLTDLRSYYSDTGEERGGYITSDFKTHEVENSHPNKVEGFAFSIDDLEKLEDEDVIATFHTHPDGKANLSKEDAIAFKNWYEFSHFIVGKEKIMCYKVTDRFTIVVEDINASKD